MIRAYVGIETNSDEGIVSLNRRITSGDNRRAMEVLRDLVDPLPPPLQCSTVDTGQPLIAATTLAGDTVDVVIAKGVPFTVSATITGFSGKVCSLVRTFRVTVSDGGVQVSLHGADTLPLPARQHAEIVLARREGRVVRLEASTAWDGNRSESWSVSHVLDFGPDGLAFDTLLLEVVTT